MKTTTLSIDVSEATRVTGVLHAPAKGSGVGFVFGHGAGSDMASPFMVAFAEGLAARGFTVLRFNFAYKEIGRRVPDPGPKLEKALRAATLRLRAEPSVERVLIGGKSMGGRIASLAAAHGLACDGLVFLGYPLHAAGKTALRDAHLPAVTQPMLFVQGTRDALCNLDRLAPVLDRLGDRATLHVIDGGDHSLDVLKSKGVSRETVYAEVMDAIEAWTRRAVIGK